MSSFALFKGRSLRLYFLRKQITEPSLQPKRIGQGILKTFLTGRSLKPIEIITPLRSVLASLLFIFGQEVLTRASSPPTTDALQGLSLLLKGLPFRHVEGSRVSRAKRPSPAHAPFHLARRVLLNFGVKPVREIIKKFKLKNHHYYTGGPRLTTICSETIQSYDGAVKITTSHL